MFFGETYPSFTRKNCLFIEGLKEFISLLVNSLKRPSVKYIAVISYPAGIGTFALSELKTKKNFYVCG